MSEIRLHSLVLKPTAKAMSLRIISETRQEDCLLGLIGQTLVSSGQYTKSVQDHTMTLTWKAGMLRVTHNVMEDGERYDLVWTSEKASKLVDAFDLRNGHWYGGAQIKRQTWPIEKWRMKAQPMVTGNSLKGEYGGVQERYWLSSKGVALHVDQNIPLFVGVNDGDDFKLTFISKQESPYNVPSKAILTLKYTIFKSTDVKRVHTMATRLLMQRPLNIPCEALFRAPIWSTWAYYKNEINQKKVLKYARYIAAHKFPVSQFEIDDNWTACYGEHDFDKRKFPKALQLIQSLKQMGYPVTMWVHPFATVKSPASKQGDFWAKGTVTWWNGMAKCLDVTNPTAELWFKSVMMKLKNHYGVTSFKFDAGEAHYIPKKWGMRREAINPNMYSTRYAELAYEIDKDQRRQEVRVGSQTQHLPIFVRMMDKESRWGEDNGLRTVIPNALTFSLLGYPFILPDMIGGNAYREYPNAELFVRWLQVCTLMPAMQFSITPWEYGTKVVNIARKMLTIRERFVDYILDVARHCVKTGEPIIRPLWWVAPHDEFAQVTDSEFLVGNDVLVAPVLENGARSRMVYLPSGSWRDELTGDTLEGGRFYFNYEAALDELPHFTRMGTSLHKTRMSQVVTDTDLIQFESASSEESESSEDSDSSDESSSETSLSSEKSESEDEGLDKLVVLPGVPKPEAPDYENADAIVKPTQETKPKGDDVHYVNVGDLIDLDQNSQADTVTEVKADIKEEVKEEIKEVKEEVKDVVEDVKDTVEETKEKAEEAKEEVLEIKEKIPESKGEAAADIKEHAKEVDAKKEEFKEEVKQEVAEKAKDTAEHITEIKEDIKPEFKEAKPEVKEEAAKEVADKVKQEVTEDVKAEVAEVKKEEVKKEVIKEVKKEEVKKEEVKDGVIDEGKKEEVKEDVKKEITLELKKEVAQEVKKEVAQEVKKEVAQEVKKEVIQEVKKEITEEVQKENEDVKKTNLEKALDKVTGALAASAIEEKIQETKEDVVDSAAKVDDKTATEGITLAPPPAPPTMTSSGQRSSQGASLEDVIFRNLPAVAASVARDQADGENKEDVPGDDLKKLLRKSLAGKEEGGRKKRKTFRRTTVLDKGDLTEAIEEFQKAQQPRGQEDAATEAEVQQEEKKEKRKSIREEGNRRKSIREEGEKRKSIREEGEKRKSAPPVPPKKPIVPPDILASASGAPSDPDLPPIRRRPGSSRAEHVVEANDKRSSMLDEFKVMLRVKPVYDDETETHRADRVKTFFQLKGTGRVQRLIAEMEGVYPVTGDAEDGVEALRPAMADSSIQTMSRESMMRENIIPADEDADSTAK